MSLIKLCIKNAADCFFLSLPLGLCHDVPSSCHACLVSGKEGGRGEGKKGVEDGREGRREVTIGHVKKGFVSQDYT